ncbi:MAG: uracil phosphoribosyltransferase [Phycisphaeraceae bacterium]
MSASDPKLFVCEHPLIQHLLAEARDQRTGPMVFRRLLRQVGAMLAYEALRDLPRITRRIQTPMEAMEVQTMRAPVTIVPILRAGLGLADGMLEVLPDARMGHIGLFRDESTLNPVTYYEKLPEDIAGGPTLLVDPMLATGGSACEALAKLWGRNCVDVRFVCLVASPEGVKRLHELDPNVPIYTAAVDRQLNEKGYILPGLGDAGDRLYGTG